MRRTFFGLVVRLAAFFAWGGILISQVAADVPQGRLFDLTDENDAWSNFFGPHQDRHYTHGFKLTYFGAEHCLTNGISWLQKISTWGIEPAAGNLGFVFGQNMFTPEDILDPNPIPTDRPYAGWLYAGLVYQRHSEPAANFAVMENFEINLGLVGPDSGADDNQKIIHRWRFPEDIPQGWDNQIHDEPGLVLKYARLWRLSPVPCTVRYFDVIPRAGFELGNVAIFATVGATARLGFNLPDDFGVQFIDSPSSVSGRVSQRGNGFSIYAFAGVDGRAVLHDITLDGNSFRSSARVDKYNFVNDLSWGIAVQPCRYVSFSYAQITRSKQFHGQRDKDVFGSIDAKVMVSF
jgi:hypothetical protein